MTTATNDKIDTERLLLLYGEEINAPITLGQLIESHRAQRAMIAQLFDDLQEVRQEEMQRMYAGYDLARISELRELINDLLDNYIDEVEQSKRRVGNEQQN